MSKISFLRSQTTVDALEVLLPFPGWGSSSSEVPLPLRNLSDNSPVLIYAPASDCSKAR